MVRGNLPSNDHVALLSNQLVARISGLPDHHIRLALLCRGLHLFSHAARDHAGRHHRTGRCDFLRHGLVESAIHLLSGQCGATLHGALCAFVAFLPENHLCRGDAHGAALAGGMGHAIPLGHEPRIVSGGLQCARQTPHRDGQCFYECRVWRGIHRHRHGPGVPPQRIDGRNGRDCGHDQQAPQCVARHDDHALRRGHHHLLPLPAPQ